MNKNAKISITILLLVIVGTSATVQDVYDSSETYFECFDSDLNVSCSISSDGKAECFESNDGVNYHVKNDG